MTNPIRQHDEKFRRIQRLIFPEKFACKLRSDKLCAAARRPVHDKHGITGLALRIALGFPERPIMNPQFWQRLTRGELKIANRVIVFPRRWIIGRA